MKVVKLGLISLVVFSVMITLLSFLFPSRVRISKAIDIKTGREELLQQLRDTAAWRQWNTLSGNASLPSVTAVTDSSVVAEAIQPNGRKGTMGWNIYAGSVPNTLTVQWYMDFRLRWYPWEKFSGILFEKRYGPAMESGLEKLRQILTH